MAPGSVSSRIIRYSLVVDGNLQTFDRTAFVRATANWVGVMPANIVTSLSIVTSINSAALEPLLPATPATRRRGLVGVGYLLVNVAILPSPTANIANLVARSNALLASASQASAALGVSTLAIPALPSVVGVVGVVGRTADQLAAAAGVVGVAGIGSTSDLLLGVAEPVPVIAWDTLSTAQVRTAQLAVSTAVAVGITAGVLSAVTASSAGVISSYSAASASTAVGGSSGSASSSIASLTPLVFGVQRLAMRAGVHSPSAPPATAGLIGAASSPLGGLLGASGVWSALVGSGGGSGGGGGGGGGVSGRRLAAQAQAEDAAAEAAQQAITQLLSPQGLPEPFAPLLDVLITTGLALAVTMAAHALLLCVWRRLLAAPAAEDGRPPKGGSSAGRRPRHVPLPTSLVGWNPEITVLLYFTSGLGEAAVAVLAHAARAAAGDGSSGSAVPYPIVYVVVAALVVVSLVLFAVLSLVHIARFYGAHASVVWVAAEPPTDAAAVNDPMMRLTSRLGTGVRLLRAPVHRGAGGFERSAGADADAAEEDSEPARTHRLLSRPLSVCKARAVAGDALEALALLLENGRGDALDRVCLQPLRLCAQLLIAAVLASAASPEAIGPVQLILLALLQLPLGLWLLVRSPSADRLESVVEGLGHFCEAASSVLLLIACAQPSAGPALSTASAYALLVGTVGLPSALSCYDELLSALETLANLCRRAGSVGTVSARPNKANGVDTIQLHGAASRIQSENV